MAELFPITLYEQIQAVERELAMRRKVYPRRVADRKMTQAKADREIAAMEAIHTTLTALNEGRA